MRERLNLAPHELEPGDLYVGFPGVYVISSRYAGEGDIGGTAFRSKWRVELSNGKVLPATGETRCPIIREVAE